MNRVINVFKSWIAEYKRTQALNRQLENLTDPTLLDRMIKGE